jgi:hypothetical protein
MTAFGPLVTVAPGKHASAAGTGETAIRTTCPAPGTGTPKPLLET